VDGVTPLETVELALERAGCRRQRPGQWTCPSHEDRKASLSVKEGRDGRVLLTCHANSGCTIESITAALGLEMRELFPAKPDQGSGDDWTPAGPAIATYLYTDAKGKTLFGVCRTADKQFPQWRPDPSKKHGRAWKLTDSDGKPLVRRVLYRLPKVLAAIEAGKPVYVVEGEKDVHALEGADVTATCNPGGAGKWRADYTRTLQGATVIIVADDDDAGRAHARIVARKLTEAGCPVRVVRAAEGKDASDHLAAGHGVGDFIELEDKVEPVSDRPKVEIPQDGAAVLDKVLAVLRKFVVLPSDHAAVAAVLWIAASHAQPAWEHATRLVIKSPMKRCGKSRLLTMLDGLCCNVLITVNISPAALVRSITDDDPPTLLVDEADVIFGTRKQADNNEDLRGLLNAGHERGRPYIRWDIAAHAREECATFAMAALAGIGEWCPDTIEDRAVIVTMRRRAPGERVTPYRRRRDKPGLLDLRDQLDAFITAHRDKLEVAEPAMPVEDRAADCWEPLVAIADLVGGNWPTLARAACKAMTAEADASAEGSASERLLADLKVVFGETDALYTKTILAKLHAIEEAPWGDWFGKPLAARDLAKLLRPYGVRSTDVREGGGPNLKGYRREDLHEQWRRYIRDKGDTAGEGRRGSVADEGEPSATGSTSEDADVADVADPPREDGRLLDPGGDYRRYTR
jgi:5S rRNA maturation endonuclease (ribonuclease M5)